MLLSHTPSLSLSDFCSHTSVFQDKTEENWNKAMDGSPACLPCQGSKTMMSLLFISRQPPHSLWRPCQHPLRCQGIVGSATVLPPISCLCSCRDHSKILAVPVLPAQAHERASDVWSSTSCSCFHLPWLGNWVNLSLPPSSGCWTLNTCTHGKRMMGWSY